MITARLTIVERLNLLSILPEQGGFATAKAIKSIRERLSLTEEEIEQYVEEQDVCPACRRSGGTRFVNLDKSKPKSFSFSGLEVALIVNSLKKLDKEEKLMPAHVPLWEKFVESPEEHKENE